MLDRKPMSPTLGSLRLPLVASLSGRDYEDALSTNWNEDVFVPRIGSNGVAREGNIGNKLLRSGVDHTQPSVCGATREVVVVGPRVVPDFVCEGSFGNDLLTLPGCGIERHAAHTPTHGHQTPIGPNCEAADSKADQSARAFHREAFDRIREPMGIEYI